MPIAYDEVAYQTEGSNYYVTHIDSLIPLWNVLAKRQRLTPLAPIPEIFLFAFNVEGKIDLHSRGFDDLTKYWVQSLQLLVGDEVQLQVGTVSGLSRYLAQVMSSSGHGSSDSDSSDNSHTNYGTTASSSFSSLSSAWSGGDGSVLCFEEVSLGVPQYNPTRRAIRQFSQHFRKVGNT
jgi:hypothetical protein